MLSTHQHKVFSVLFFFFKFSRETELIGHIDSIQKGIYHEGLALSITHSETMVTSYLGIP